MLKTVCILTAGHGRRMGSFAVGINKVLLPVENKAAISHIVDKFPDDSHFVIVVGHLQDQVREFLSLAHPLKRFSFVEAIPFEGPGSGPGRSVLSAEKFLSDPFYLICGDSLWGDEDLLCDEDSSWMGLSAFEEGEGQNYCRAQTEEGKITNLFDKVQGQPAKNLLAYNGISFIHEPNLFFDGLKHGDSISGEHQLSSGFLNLIHQRKLRSKLVGTWKDVGTQAKLVSANTASLDFQFGKKGEFFYHQNGVALKFFRDPKTISDRAQRSVFLQPCVPRVKDFGKFFMKYDWIEGENFYSGVTPHLFEKLLAWLQQDLWTPWLVHNDDFRQQCLRFYRDKTRARAIEFLNRFPHLNRKLTINGTETQCWSDLERKVDWDFLSEGHPVRMHGDLHFDNIVFNPRNSRFTLVDWRQSFMDSLEGGDIYYDFSKLLAGLDLHFRDIKEKKYQLSDDGKEHSFWLPQSAALSECRTILRRFMLRNGFDVHKAEILKCLNYINSAPLHSDEISQLFWLSGMLQLQNLTAVSYIGKKSLSTLGTA